MKAKPYIVVSFLVLLAIAGCTTKKNYVVKIIPMQLTERNLYDEKAINDYLFDAEEQQLDSLKNKSKRLFLKGVDQLANHKNFKEAITYYKMSLLIYPDAKTYYELGLALMASNETSQDVQEEAVNALGMAGYLKFQPQSQLYYNTACAENLAFKADPDTNGGGYPENVVKDLQRAYEAGFNDTNMVKHDSRINSVLNKTQYKSMLSDLAQKKISNMHLSYFRQYARAFPVLKQPFEVSRENVAMGEYTNEISYDFAKFVPQMENTEFGRMVSNDFYYVGKVAETPRYVAILYYSSEFEGGEMQPTYTFLVTYDTTGAIISSRIFSAQFTMEKIRAGKIENNKITLTDYKRTWQFKSDSVSYWQNKVTNYEQTQVATFAINDSGRIVKETVPVNYSDSGSVVSNNIK